MAQRRALRRRIHHWIANRGIRGLLREVVYRVGLFVRGKPLPGSGEVDRGPHPFDVAYRVDTTGLVWGEALGEASGSEASQYWVTGYYGIAPSVFTAALEKLALDWPRFTFVDIGCGKGRAMLLAMRFPFRAILGVELSRELVDIANRNIAAFTAPWRQSNVPVEAVAADATEFPVPAGPLLLFLYHPFAAPVMKRFLAHLASAAGSEAREIYLLYANPELAPLLAETPGVVPLWRQTFALSAEDAAADRFGSYGETIIAYQLRG